MRRSHKPIATLATFLVAVLVVGCGGGSDEDRAAPQTTATAPNGGDADGNGDGDGDGDAEPDSDEGNPCEETVCHLFRKKKDGPIFLCTRLEIVRVPAEAEEATETSDPGETSEEEPAETPSETVLRPRCPPDATEIPVEGIDLEERPDVQTSNDGQAAWTVQPARIEGRVRDGTFVPDE